MFEDLIRKLEEEELIRELDEFLKEKGIDLSEKEETEEPAPKSKPSIKKDYKEYIDILDIHLKEISKYKVLNPKKEKELFQRIEQGDKKAREEVILCNLKLVHSVAKKYVGRGLDFEDLIQEGYIGLIKAVERFDWKKGNKFSTYAVWWIKQCISRAIDENSHLIRIPVHYLEKQKTYNFKFIPYDVPVCEFSEEEYETLNSLCIRKDIDDDSCLQDILCDDTDDIWEFLEKQNLKEILGELIDTLSDRQKEILKLRYGLEDGIERTLEDVGKLFNLTRERIRQIEEKALRRLRHPKSRNKIIDFRKC
ncbi:MAG: RNA polymerase subunit sigma [Dictyoglomus sp. NZ13-RE01]|nr:MAG: RNA polymerase subunit sigma [Dictyoglomus sp. NZ13-RE01]